MARYVVRRLVWSVLVVLLVTLATFVIFFLMPPGDPAVRFAGKQPTPALIAEVEEQLGLDKPVPVQYALFVKRLALGDEHGWPGLGFSYDSREPVKDELVERAPRTLLLVAGAALIWLTMGVAIGILSAVRHRSWADRLAMGFALFGISAPVFWLGLMALFLFWEKLEIDAVGTGYTPFSEGPGAWFGHMIMPWTVVALLYAASYARMTRGTLIDTLGEDYIRTARAKGLSERRVIVRHALRSSLTPVVTIFGMDVALFIGGAVITETVFNIQGIGAWAVSSVFGSDLPAILGVTVIAAVCVTLMNLVVDVTYAYLDPRVRYA